MPYVFCDGEGGPLEGEVEGGGGGGDGDVDFADFLALLGISVLVDLEYWI